MSDEGLSANTLSVESDIVTCLTTYKQEAENARRDRFYQNLENFDTFHLKTDFTYKKKGQSKEFLPKVLMSVEQIVSFVQQGLTDLGYDWYSMDIADGVKNPRFRVEDVKKILDRQLGKSDLYTNVADALKCGLLGSLLIFKIHGRWVMKPKWKSRKVRDSKGVEVSKLYKTTDKVWQLQIDTISPKDWYPDPTGRGLYRMHDVEMDLFDIQAQVKSDDNPYGIYDAEEVAKLSGDSADYVKTAVSARETGQNVTSSNYRNRVLVTECWGSILNAKGEIIHENCVTTIARGKYLIRPPQENPFWHGEDPFIVSPLVRVPHSEWHKALMDAPVKLNRAMNEIYNLTLDSGINSVFGVKQLRTSWLSDVSVVDDGVGPGQTLEVNDSCPPGAKVLERVDESIPLQSGMEVYNLTNSEFQQASMTNDLRMGVLPQRQVKATEIVESSQSITSMLNGVTKALEVHFIQPTLAKAWMTCVQHADDFDDTEIEKLLGPTRAGVWKSATSQERFAETVNGLTFNVFGLTNTLNKMKDFRRITTLLQTIASNEVLMETFAKEYDFNKLLNEIMKSLDVNTDKLRLDPDDGPRPAAAPPQPPGMPGAPGEAGAGSPGAPPPAAPNAQSQIMQSASGRAGPAERSGPIPQTKFPPSPVSKL